ncbi:unnamed protein product [Soboliphyme baturini]|uniref:Reverse transcriptase domain-containing protein n=1 Tax=Soboliphyme baturini TaxID=241478 RepID=A0A183JA04_9BILA|nr:unnamed protein product [Soboliphyme baturini]
MEYHTKISWQKQLENQMGNIMFGGDQAKFPNNIARRIQQVAVMTTNIETELQLYGNRIFYSAAECCGFKRLPRRLKVRITCSWMREVQLAVNEKKAAFKKWLASKELSTCV